MQPHQPSHEPPDSGTGEAEYLSIRRFIVVAQITALASLLFGGMLLSTVAIVVAVIAYRKASFAVQTHQGEQMWPALKRSAVIAITMGVVTLTLNIVAIVYLYPMLVEMAQTGDYSSLFGSSQQGSTGITGSGNSTWG